MLMENQKTLTRWAVHKLGTEQIGYLYADKDEAERILSSLKHDMAQASNADMSAYIVVEVQLSWSEPNALNADISSTAIH